jgi:hypothetical protein
MYIWIVIGLFIISAVICHLIAKIRGAHAVFWGVMGALFGPLAIPFVFYAKALPSHENE